MEGLAPWLPLIWAAILVVAVALYVVLDGFDLGVGILFPWAHGETERDLMMNSVAPFWDGNETWLVLGGGGLLVAFPTAFGIIMPALYLPVIVMLLALVFRGVSFEFRWIAKPHHRVWDWTFTTGSTAAAFAQGVILGGLLEGIRVEGNAFAGGSFDWLTPFTVLTGAGVTAGYALLGATWLVMKAEGPVAERARRQARGLLVAVMAAMGAVSLWTPFVLDHVFARWFTLPNFLYLAPIPILVALTALWAWTALARGAEKSPFVASIILFLLGFFGLVVSNYPYLVPPVLTIRQAAAVPESQLFMLVGVVLVLPLILGYTFVVYRTFRGKVRPGEGYH
jgi:cytochrome d ubiquinol oxidase subunit II